jgi:signal transduction histidine kinase
LLALLVTVALVSFLGGWFINREFEQYVAEQEKTRSENIVTDLSLQYNNMTRAWDQDFLHTIGMYSLYDGYILKVYDADGNVQWDAENHDMSLCGQIMNEISARMESIEKQGGFSAHTYDIEQGGRKIGSASITYYGPYFFSESDFRFIKALNSALLISGVLAAIFSLAIGSLLARRIARPVTKTAHIATQISRGNYDIRFEGGANTRELNELADAVNQLAGALSGQERLRKRLTTDVAHELRTPLAAVGSHLEAMVSGIWEATPERLQACYGEIQRLGRLVADLQRLTDVESEGLEIEKSKVDLKDIVDSAIANMAAEASKKNLSLSAEGGSAFVHADGERILQVVTNLLSNAIKFTPEGGNIRAIVADTKKLGLIKVEDDGIGIPERELPLIFERFYRTDKSRSRETGGAGIGLTIAKSIVTAHGGTITAEEGAGGRGSCFTVLLPKTRCP